MFESILSELECSQFHLHGIELLKGGETVLHKSYGADVRLPVYSVTKSLTSAAFCLAVGDGLLSPELPLAQFLEKRCCLPEGFEKLPFERFLTMTAGEYPFRPQGENWLDYIFSLDTDFSDTAFHYSNIPAYLVGAACENAVGGDLMAYLEKRLFEPLGIPRPTFAKSPEGHFYGATGMELTVRELALLGQLYLQKGKWQNQQLISSELVSRSVSPIVPTDSGDSYGWFVRAADDHFSFVGKWGQRCMVYPQKELVIAYLSHNPDSSQQLYQLIRDFTAANIQ